MDINFYDEYRRIVNKLAENESTIKRAENQIRAIHLENVGLAGQAEMIMRATGLSVEELTSNMRKEDAEKEKNKLKKPAAKKGKKNG